MKMLIYLLGLDGSGKTTSAKRLVKEDLNNYKVSYKYWQYTPILLYPLKILAKLIFLRDTDEFIDYKKYNNKKKRFSQKMKILTKLYSYIWYFDYIIQIIPKLFITYFRKKEIIIIDRYYLDSVINLACLNNYDQVHMLRDARMIEAILPKADMHIFLDVSEKKAFLRKDDIQSIEYLAERKTKYLKLAKFYNFKIIDADLSKKAVCNRIYNYIIDEIKK